MKRLYKLILIILILITILFNLTGCYDAKGIETYAYVIAIGIDYIGNDELELTLQFAKPESSSSNGEESQGTQTSQSSDTTITSIKCKTINSGISLINAHISKKINLSNCQEIIFSEELAKKGLSSYLDTLANNVEIRTDCNIIISRESAKKYISSVKPELEPLTARYYESSLNSNQYTGYTVQINISDFYSSLKDSYSEPYAVLGGINPEKSSLENNSTNENQNNLDNNNSNNSNNKEGQNNSIKINGNYLAGEVPITDKDTVEVLGIAAFKKDKLVGELTGLDSICHLLINNKLQQCILSIPNPFEENKFIDLEITCNKKTKCKIIQTGENPIIEINTYLVGYGLTLDHTINYDSIENLNLITSTAEKYIKEQIINYLYKTSKELNADICGLGKYAVPKYLTIQEWEKAKWLDNYKNATFNVNVELNLKSGSIFNKS